MLRNDLLENGYHFETIEPKKHIINFMWTGIALIFIAPVLLLYFMIMNGDLSDVPLPYIEMSATAVNIIFIAAPVIYFILKEILSTVFSADRNKNIQIRYATETGIPVWVGREAFKTWQTAVIYLTPLILIYPILLLASIISGGNINLLVLIFIMTFFMSSDFTLVLYILLLKIRYNAEYVAVKNHIYTITLYSQTSIERKSYSDGIRDRLARMKKTIKNSMPSVNLRTVLIPIIIAVMLFVSVRYFIMNKEQFIEVNPDDYETYLEYCDATQPVIKKYADDIYSDIYHAAGNNAGCEFLAGRNILYCNDNGAVIYFDSEKNSVMRLNSRDKTERLCIYEDCRNNLGEMCGHMPDFVSNGCYSEGVLYGVQPYLSKDKTGIETIKSYVIRYIIGENTMDKLIEFEMGEDDAYIRSMFIYSGYLYAVAKGEDTITGYISNIEAARIDLEKEEACIVYSDNKNPKNRDKIERLIYNENTVLSSVDGNLYSCGTDMSSFTSISSFNSGEVKYFYTHNGNMYYFTSYNYLYGYIFNDNSKSYDTTLLYDSVYKKLPAYDSVFSIIAFCADSDFLYFTMRESRIFYHANGVYSHGELHEDGIIYRIKLDDGKELEIINIDFDSKFGVYTPEPGYTLSEWNVKDDCIYAVLSSDNGGKTLLREKISSTPKPYIFWQ